MTRCGSASRRSFQGPRATRLWIRPRITPTCWVKPSAKAPTRTSPSNSSRRYLKPARAVASARAGAESGPSTPIHSPNELVTSPRVLSTFMDSEPR